MIVFSVFQDNDHKKARTLWMRTGGTLYNLCCISNPAFKTTDSGVSWNMIRTSSDRITYIAVDPLNAQKVYVTNSGYTAGSKVWKSVDGGTTWVNFSGTLPNLPVNCILWTKFAAELQILGQVILTVLLRINPLMNNLFFSVFDR